MAKEKLPITAYCSCKNGEPYIRKALESVGCCEQKIYLDDSSTDDSVKIAKELGWEIWHWPEDAPDSMSERRNYAIAWEGNDTYTPYWMTREDLKSNHPEIKHNLILQLDHDEIWADNTPKALKKLTSDKEIEMAKEVGITAYAVHLVNVYTEGERKGQSMTEIPLPRIFTKGDIHWEKVIQNDPVFEGEVNFTGIRVDHFGYGSYRIHWEKQFSRLTANEERVREDPNDLMSRAYLINCLTVVAGTGILAFDRIIAQMSLALDNKKEIMHDRKTQVTIERCFRHIWSVCVNLRRFHTFLYLLVRNEKHIDWIADVHYWKIMCLLQMKPVNITAIEESAKKFLKTMAEYKKPPVMNIEMQSIGYELALCQKVYSLFLSALLNLDISDMNTKEIGKKCEYWFKQHAKYSFIHEMERKGIPQHETELIKTPELIDYSSKYQWGNDIQRERITADFQKQLNKKKNRKGGKKFK